MSTLNQLLPLLTAQAKHVGAPQLDGDAAFYRFLLGLPWLQNDSLKGVVNTFPDLCQLVEADREVQALAEIVVMKHATCLPVKARFVQNVNDCNSLLQANTMTKRNSLARNLHRLRTVVHFIQRIMFLLASDNEVSLSAAVSKAYNETMGPYHSTLVRTTCQAGFMLLPTREAFLDSIGETGMRMSNACKRLLQNWHSSYLKKSSAVLLRNLA
jgi:hypothetical protein